MSERRIAFLERGEIYRAVVDTLYYERIENGQKVRIPSGKYAYLSMLEDMSEDGGSYYACEDWESRACKCKLVVQVRRISCEDNPDQENDKKYRDDQGVLLAGMILPTYLIDSEVASVIDVELNTVIDLQVDNYCGLFEDSSESELLLMLENADLSEKSDFVSIKESVEKCF